MATVEEIEMRTAEDLFKLCMDSEKLFRWCQKNKLLGACRECVSCGNAMYEVKDKSRIDGYIWRCPSCKSKKSVRADSWFSSSKLSIRTILKVTYWWSRKISLTNVAHECGLSLPTIVDWFSFCREVCVDMVITKRSSKIGGPGIIVEIDELKFGKRKYHKGKRVEGQWVFGGVERGQPPVRCFLVCVPDRGRDTLYSVIHDWIEAGTVIISDCWSSYKTLDEEGFEHFSVNHSVTFKDPETGAHINTVEGMWHLAKSSLPKFGTRKHMYDSYFGEFMWRRLHADTDNLFMSFLDDICALYKCGTD
ncbi:uncharacterized protein LOC141911570 [Tubulanus polymorphus]|uniref:uncharacterized protein LOC141911570 n=1 Tax=Tubulanus polymorphus TaxID=672921 RepID=UPI003DA2D926